MEYVIATLKNPTRGKCDGCGSQGELVKAITQINRDDDNRDAMGQPQGEGRRRLPNMPELPGTPALAR